MQAIQAKSSKLSHLVRQIEGDIRARGLQPGDRYHSCADAGLLLGVSPATAHRVMNVLVRRNMLTREQGRGTFVGDGIGKTHEIAVRTLYILIEEQLRDLTSVPLDILVAAVRQVWPQTNVQFCFIPNSSSIEFLRQLVEVPQRAGQFAGAIPISCSRAVYRYLAETGAPVVVLGSLYRDQWQLASVDLDYKLSGKILAKYLVSRGHKKIALLTTGGGRPGDNALYDGITQALTEAGLSPNSLVVRMFPQDFDGLHEQINELMQQEDRPTGIISASDRLVGFMASCAQNLGLSLPRDLELVFESQVEPSGALAQYPYVKPRLSFHEVATTVARLLKKVAKGEPLENKRVVIPVELHVNGKAAGVFS